MAAPLQRVATLIERCFSANPSERPTSREVYDALITSE